MNLKLYHSHTHWDFSSHFFKIPENDSTDLNLKYENAIETSPSGCGHHEEGSIEINQTQVLSSNIINDDGNILKASNLL